jgi:hypothetical protein
MRSIYLFAACLAGLAAVSGCANGKMIGIGEDDYVVTSATPDSITLRFREGNLDKATARALAHCRTTNRTAEMVNLAPEKGFSVGAFRCV